MDRLVWKEISAEEAKQKILEAAARQGLPSVVVDNVLSPAVDSMLESAKHKACTSGNCPAPGDGRPEIGTGPTGPLADATFTFGGQEQHIKLDYEFFSGRFYYSFTTSFDLAPKDIKTEARALAEAMVNALNDMSVSFNYVCTTNGEEKGLTVTLSQSKVQKWAQIANEAAAWIKAKYEDGDLKYEKERGILTFQFHTDEMIKVTSQ